MNPDDDRPGHTTGARQAPVSLGLVLLASLLAAGGYVVVRLAWRCYLLRSWRRRRIQRKSPAGARQ